MSNETKNSLKPFLSVGAIVLTLLLVVIVKMEVRRTGYVLWKQAKVEKYLKEKYFRTSVKLAKKNGPTRIKKYAQSRLAMQSALFGQIVQLSNDGLALKQ